jgi:hypothetical protein
LLGLTGCAASGPVFSAPNNTVVIRGGRQLQPAVVVVNGGDRVMWINDTGGDVVLQFTGVTIPLEGSPSRPMYKFDRPGRYEYVLTATSPETSGGVFVAKLRGEVVVNEAVPADQAPSRADIVRLRGSLEALSVYGYQSRQGIVVRAERGAATPAEPRAGEPVVLLAQYSVLAPLDGARLTVRESWIITHNDQELGRLDKEATLGPGTYESQQRLVLPSDAPAGTYVVRARLEVQSPGRSAVSDQTSIRFVVRTR